MLPKLRQLIDDVNHRHNQQLPQSNMALLNYTVGDDTDAVALPNLAAGLDLSPAQCHVLHLIEPARPIPMGQLAETLACDASNVTGLVDRLESRGLVRRHPSTEDRRVKVFELTPAGSRLRTLLL